MLLIENRYRNLLILFIILLSNSLYSQCLHWEWADTDDNNNNDIAKGIVADSFGNVYATGCFTGSTTFGSHTITSVGGYDIYLVKYTSAGEVLWAVSAGGSSDDGDLSVHTDKNGNNCIDVDSYGNIYITGSFTSNDMSFGAINLANSTGYDVFVAKYDNSGNSLWAKSAIGDDNETANGIAVDNSDNVYICGYFEGDSIDFEGNVFYNQSDPNFSGPPGTMCGGNYGSPRDIFLVKYDSNGNYLWARAQGGASQDEAYDIETDQENNVLITGYFTDTVNIGLDTLTTHYTYVPCPNSDIFIAKYDSSGNSIWAKNAGSPTEDMGKNICTDQNGNVFVSGDFRGFIWFDDEVNYNNGYMDMILVKFDSDGNHIWSSVAGGDYSDSVNSMCVDTAGNVYVTGNFSQALYVENDTFPSAGAEDFYILKYDNDGNRVWTEIIGTHENESCKAITVDQSGNLYLTGSFVNEDIYFGDNQVVSNINLGGNDIFISKFHQYEISVDFANITSVNCNGDCSGSATILATNGISPYYFDWPDGVTDSVNISLCANIYSISVTDDNYCTTIGQVEISDTSDLLIKLIDMGNVTCSGLDNGFATVNAMNGTPPYSYTWNDTNNQTGQDVIDLSAGSYYVTAVDADQCSDVLEVIILEPYLEAYFVEIQEISCVGSCDGVMLMDVVDGTPPYTYNWNTNETTESISDYCPGWLIVHVKDGFDCYYTYYHHVAGPQAIFINESFTGVDCYNDNDGFGAVTPTAGTPPYTYDWGNGNTDSVAYDLYSGVYIVTVTDANSCTDIGYIIVDQPDSISPNLVISDHDYCNQCTGIVNLNTDGGTPFTTGNPYLYSWSNGNTASYDSTLCQGEYFLTIADANDCEQVIEIKLDSIEDLDFTVWDIGEDNCGHCEGFATIEPVGGTEPYQIEWSDGSSGLTADNLCEGTYFVSLTDSNDCYIDTIIHIADTSTFDNLITVTDSLSCLTACNGIASINVSGGSMPYFILWSNGTTGDSVSSLCGGEHTVTITDDFYCQEVFEFSIDSAEVINLEISNVGADNCGKCEAYASITPSGGTLPYHISWSDGSIGNIADSLCEGIYQVTLIDSNDCFIDTVIEISDTSTFESQLSITDTITCYSKCNGSAFVYSNGGQPPYIINWSNSYTGDSIADLCAGYQTVTVSDQSNCIKIMELDLAEPEEIMLDFYLSEDTNHTCVGEAYVIAIGDFPPYSYTWIDTVNYTNDTITGLCAGMYYSLIVSDSMGCEIIDSISVTNTSVIEITDNENIRIYPNPTRNGVTIEHYTLNTEFELFSSNGQLIRKYLLEHELTYIDLSFCSDGIYFYSIKSDNSTATGKIVIIK